MVHKCGWLDAAELPHVARLTRLTYLKISGSATDAGPAQLAQLAQLTNMQELRADGHSIRGEAAAALLELPGLGALSASSVAVPPGQGVSGSAITRLVLQDPAVADLESLPRLPTLRVLIIATATAGTISSIRVLQQLTELAVWKFNDVQAGELAEALQGLRQLRVLELDDAAACFDRQCLLAVAGMPQLQELWLDGDSEDLAPGMSDCMGVLHRCSRLREVTLQRCDVIISKATLIGLVGQPGMRKVVLTGGHGLAASAVSEVRALGAGTSCALLCKGLSNWPRCGEYFTNPV
jgi:hypothetical protein